MNDSISFNKTYFDTSSNVAKKAADYMENVVNDSDAAISSIPSGFIDESSAIAAINGLKETCIYSDSLRSDYTGWGLLMDKINNDPDNVYLFDFGDGSKYVAFDNVFMVFVTPGTESDYDGVPYPLDQYVMGVVDGEGEAQEWGRECYDGKITTTEFLNMVKAFSVMARSYGIHQTYNNSDWGHDEDHKIQSSDGKQCFNTRLFEDTNRYPGGWSLYTTTTVAGVLETSFIAYGNDEGILPLYYRESGGQVAKVHDLALQGMDWISILKEVYPNEFEVGGLKYFDVVKDESMPGDVRIDILGDVPDDTEVSKMISKNLSDDENAYTSTANPDSDYRTTWTYALKDGERTVTVETESETGYSNSIPFDESTLRVETQPPGPTSTPDPTPTATPGPTATPSPTETPKVTPGPTVIPPAASEITPSPLTPSPTATPEASPSITAKQEGVQGSPDAASYNELLEEKFKIKKWEREQREKEQPKADEPKADEPKADEPKADEPKADEPKVEPKADEPRADEPRADPTPEPTPIPTPQPTYVLPENQRRSAKLRPSRRVRDCPSRRRRSRSKRAWPSRQAIIANRRDLAVKAQFRKIFFRVFGAHQRAGRDIDAVDETRQQKAHCGAARQHGEGCGLCDV